MKQTLLATVAVVALSFPAMAQTKTQQNVPNQQSQTQQSGNKQSSGKQTQRINPLQLSNQEVRQIQEALNKKGFNAREADGIWGPETEAALRNFQKKQNINANGELTHQTLADLGVNLTSQKGTVGAAPSTTTGSGSNSGSNSGSKGMMKQPNASGSGGKSQRY